MLISQRIIALAEQIEQMGPADPAGHDLIQELVQQLTAASQKPAVQARYHAGTGKAFEGNKGLSAESYPIDADGFAKSFDALTEEEAFWRTWQKFGFVVGRQVVPPALCRLAVSRIQEMLSRLSHGACDLERPETYESLPMDSAKTPIISRGFLDIYHDDSLAQLRQAVRLYVHHAVIWGRADLWTSFDRFGVKLPDHADAGPLPLHVDQNPLVHPEFKTIQGVLALEDCPIERGTFCAVPGSRDQFPMYRDMARNLGEYVELDRASPMASETYNRVQLIPVRAGDIVTWDSRTTHANSGNLSDRPRYVAYIAAGPAPEKDRAQRLATRREAFKTGIGSNVREALMHATRKPRYANAAELQNLRKPERMSLLGDLLYGWKRYDSISP